MAGPTLSQRIGQAGAQLAIAAHALWLAARDPRTPWTARLLALFIAAYALSPIDLIPDFIPVLGWLDDLLLVPAGVWLVRRLIPDALYAEHFATAQAASERPRSRLGLAIILILWALALWLIYWAVRTSPYD
jgi:uncharacterized membrane protein YkvA (DUF1232 family)